MIFFFHKKLIMSACKLVNLTQTRFLSYKRILSWYSGLVKPRPQEPPYNHIVQIGDPCLRAVSENVSKDLITSPEIKFLINRMRYVMKKYQCFGIAATQIGMPFRVFMMELNDKSLKEYTASEQKIKEINLLPFTVVFNPVLKVLDSTKITFSESCESIKGFSAEVPRFHQVLLTGLDQNAQNLEIHAKGWTARIIQHEMDHLDGVLYTDLMDRKSLACCCWTVINERGGKVELPYGVS